MSTGLLGLSWPNQQTVVGSILEGSLAVSPVLDPRSLNPCFRNLCVQNPWAPGTRVTFGGGVVVHSYP